MLSLVLLYENIYDIIRVIDMITDYRNRIQVKIQETEILNGIHDAGYTRHRVKKQGGIQDKEHKQQNTKYFIKDTKKKLKH